MDDYDGAYSDAMEEVASGNFSQRLFADGCKLWKQREPLDMTLKILLFAIIVIISGIGNSLIVYVVIKFEKTRNCTNLFICNMAIADLLASLFCAYPGLATNLFQNYMLGPFYCKFEGFSKGIDNCNEALTHVKK